MKARMQDTNFVFTLLQVCTGIAILPALALLAIFLRWWDTPYTLPRVMQVLLWIIAWGSFGLMCQRLKHESAFTKRNARSLMCIAVCCGATGLVQALGFVGSTAVKLGNNPALTTAVTIGVNMILPAAFLGVSAVALTLRHLLLRARAMQQENELTI